jgi:hypothetical protein
MENHHFLKNSQIIVLGVCIALATIISSLIFSHGLIQMKKFSQEVITVTGSAEKNIMSDYIVWKSSFSRRDIAMTAAYQALKEDLEQVKAYLLKQGIKENEIALSPISTTVLYKKIGRGDDTNEIEGYRLSQTVEIRSPDVRRVSGISQGLTELIDQGIELISYSPEYFYTRLADLKVEMLSKATENGKQRAENMATATGNKIGFMRSARMGVFQITPINSYEISDWGTNDTTSLEKKVTAVVNVSFAIR